MSVPTVPVPNTGSEDRRDHPRHEISERIRGQLVSLLEVPITLVGISRGGFSMRLSHECRVGEIYDVRFWCRSDSPVVLTAMVMHTERTVDPDGAARDVAGLEFLEQERPHIHKAIEALIKRVEDDPSAP